MLTKEQLKQMTLVFGKLLTQLPYFFTDRAHSSQAVLEWWQEWLREDGKNYFWKRHWNQRVPGQLSFNDHRQAKNIGVLLALQDKPRLPSLLFALSALLSGSSLTILCKSHETALVWKVFEGVLRSCGISAEHCAVYSCEEHKLQTVLADPRLEFCILDGDALQAEGLLAHFMSATSASMRSLFTLAEAPDVRDPQRYLDHFVHVRSFAINTMRHGAPLEVEWQ